MTDGKEPVCRIAKITKGIEREEEEEHESLHFLPFLHLYLEGLGSNYNWDQLLVFGHVDISVPQESPRMIPGQFLHSIQLFWQFFCGHVYASAELLKFRGSVRAA